MAINFPKKAANLSVLVHVTANHTINAVGNDSVSDLATTGEYVTGSKIKQVWTGSPSSGTSVYWQVFAANATANLCVGVYDSTAWIDYAGVGAGFNLVPDADKFHFILNGVAENQGYLMIEIKKELGNAP